MTATGGKFDAVLTKMDAKMDDLLKAKADQEVKFELHSSETREPRSKPEEDNR